jgi:hypothetical protein
MDTPIFDTSHEGSILERVQEGMHVVDADGEEVGKVEHVFLGDVGPSGQERGQGPATASEPDVMRDSFFDQLAQGLRDDNLPETVRNRLLRGGFLRLGGGLLGRDRYIMPEQIADVSGERVTLKTTRDELLAD